MSQHPSIRSLSTCIAVLILGVLSSGCSTSKDEILPRPDSTMMDVWQQGTTGSGGSTAGQKLMDARQSLRRPISAAELAASNDQAEFSRTSQNEIYSQFKRLPNPDLVMYVFPHLAGSDPAPVPGYTTVFPFYQRVQYAMPGERTEDY